MTKSAAAVLFLIALCAAPAARADCADEAGALRAKLRDAKPEAHREEAMMLADKAEIDGRKGRERLCLDALARARGLVR